MFTLFPSTVYWSSPTTHPLSEPRRPTPGAVWSNHAVPSRHSSARSYPQFLRPDSSADAHAADKSVAVALSGSLAPLPLCTLLTIPLSIRRTRGRRGSVVLEVGYEAVIEI
jgi:hypothetical protein